MALDLNVNPYYDDFDENKNYHKILFKPGNAIQARELTQIQTILQDQIKKLGKFVLAEGSRVYGAQIFSDYNAISVKLYNPSTNLYSYKGKYVVGSSSKLAGYITDLDVTSGYIFVKPINSTATNNFASSEQLNIFETRDLALAFTINDLIAPSFTEKVNTETTISIKNASGSQYSKNLSINTLNLEIGDVLSSSGFKQSYVVTDIIDGYTCIVDKTLEADFTNVIVNATKFPSNVVLEVGIGEGVFFSNGYLVKNLAQSIIPNPKTRFPSAVIGFEVTERIADFIDDESLLDPALGSSNYSSPGADRYVIELVIVSKPLVDDVTQELTDVKFIELVRVKRGEIIKMNLNPTLGELEKTLARQMYDHAGNFTVSPFRLNFSELELKSSGSTLNFEISPGKAYVFGKEFETTYHVNIESTKARDTNKVTSYNLQTYYGNSIQIKDLTGSVNFQNNPTIELHSVATGQSFLTKIGEAQARNIKYLASNDYNLYLFNIKLNKNAPIANVKSVVTPVTSNTYSSFYFTANTVQTNNKTVLVDPLNESLVFKYPHDNITNITNIEYDSNIIVNKNFSSNSTVIFSGDLTKQILGGTGSIPSELKKEYFRIVTKTTNGSYTENQEINLDDTDISIAQTSSDYTATISLINGKSYNGFAEIMYTVHNTSAKPKIKTLNTNKFICINATEFITSLGYSDISNVNGVYKLTANTTAAFKSDWSSSTIYNADEYVTYNNSLYKAAIQNQNISPADNTGSWVKQSPLQTGFSVDSGQKSSYYDHGNFILSGNFGIYVINFDYFTHGSGGFLSQDSYTVGYNNLPTFTNNGVQYQLRDCLDFRPRRKDLSSSIVFDSYEIPATTFSSCFSDYEYYLPRIDRLVLTDNKKFRLIQGKSKLNPIPPNVPENTLNLALIFYSPYGYTKNNINFKYDDHKRYTMDDIGVLDKRITRTEYYTTLNMSESGVLNKTTTDSLLAQRLNSGFFADNFEDLRLANFSDDNCLCTIDVGKQLCKPRMIVDPVKFQRNFDEFPLRADDFNVFHLPYTFSGADAIVVSNVVATGDMTANPFTKSSFIGTLKIYPDIDTWIDRLTTPIVNATPDSSYKPQDNSYSSAPTQDIIQGKVLNGVWIPFSMVPENHPWISVDKATGKIDVSKEAFNSGWDVKTDKDTGKQTLTNYLHPDFISSYNK